MSTNARRRATGVLADPKFREDRARKAATARTSLDHHIAKLANAADRLSRDQRAQLAAVLVGSGGVA